MIIFDRRVKVQHLFLLALLLLFLLNACSGPQVSYNEYTEIDVTYPEQYQLEDSLLINMTVGKTNFAIHPQAGYRVGAIVRGKKRYRRDLTSPISPYDLILTWGVMAEESFNRQVSYSQGGRRFFFRPKRDASVTIDWIYLNSSNNHIIPANDNIRKALSRIRKNERVLLEGYLVNVYANKKGRTISWRTSTTREDKGDGSCEIIYVKRLKNGYSVYE
jgi:hypothetical protein